MSYLKQAQLSADPSNPLATFSVVKSSLYAALRCQANSDVTRKCLWAPIILYILIINIKTKHKLYIYIWRYISHFQNQKHTIQCTVFDEICS